MEHVATAREFGEISERVKTHGERLDNIEESIGEIRRDIQKWGFRILLGLAGSALMLLAEIVLTKTGLLHPGP